MHPQAHRTRKPNCVDRYFQEVVSYGGLPATRGEIVKDLQAKGVTAKGIDAYLMGLDLGMMLRGETPMMPEQQAAIAQQVQVAIAHLRQVGEAVAPVAEPALF